MVDVLLLQQARLGQQIRQEYATLKRDPGSKYFTYVLQLQNGKFYVGVTDNIYSRILDHKLRGPSASAWVREHGPIERIVQVVRNSPADAEAYVTLDWMDMFGFENVRGAGWCRLEMPTPPAALATFSRESRAFDYMSRDEIDAVCIEVSKLERDFLFT